jgi:hypothetical protein
MRFRRNKAVFQSQVGIKGNAQEETAREWETKFKK